jgi:DUF1680 family protein
MYYCRHFLTAVILGWGVFYSAYAQPKEKIPAVASDVLLKGDPSTVRMGGYLGARIDACVEGRIRSQNVHQLVNPFYNKTRSWTWEAEFWGKWTLGAILSYRYTHDPVLLDSIKSGVKGLLGSQLPNGYIGNYIEASRLGAWDIWGQKYTLLALLSYYDLTGDKKALEASCRLANLLLSQVGPGKKDILTTSGHFGMASSSILEPMIYLYQRTADSRYLDFAEYIVAQWETEQGPCLLSKAEAGMDAANFFTAEGGHSKAYEMMSCYDGLIELYKVNKKPEYLSAVEKFARNLMDSEINILGSGSADEHWYHGKARQTLPVYNAMETCVTFTWMKLCQNLFSLTGSLIYADQIELSAYNALSASLKDDGKHILNYMAFEGYRRPGTAYASWNIPINCCSANAPRAFAMLPQFAVMQSNKDIFINLYTDLSAVLSLDKKQKIGVRQQTVYPENGKVMIQIDTDKPAVFAVNLRIPAFCRDTACRVLVNGEKQSGIISGAYYKINRTWKKGDIVELELDVAARLVKDNGFTAIVKGPVVLARDTRFADGFIDETALFIEKDGTIELTPVANKPAGVWMAFTAPLVLGGYNVNVSTEQISFCDFASAGNIWSKNVRFRVWIPTVCSFMKTPPEIVQTSDPLISI